MRRTGLLAALLLVVVAGCSTAPTPTAAPSTGDFPLTLTHRLGEAVIPAQPVRVIALGVPDVDVAAALGVAPIAATASPYASDGRWPWTPQTPGTEMLPGLGGSYDLERIAALAPDLILAHSTAGIDPIYPQLSAIAPTVVEQAGLLQDGWRAETLAIGTALGKRSEAEELVATTEQRIAGAARPGEAGYAIGWVNQPGSVAVMGSPDDTTAALFGELGLRLPQSIVDLPRRAGSGSGAGAASLSFEQLGALDTDLLLVAASSPELASALEQSPLFAQLGVVQEGRYQLISLETVSALRVPTAANIPWLLDRLQPVLGKVQA